LTIKHLPAARNGSWVPLAAVVLVVTVLWAAQAVLLPLAVGIILAFTLTPLVRLFDRIHLPRFAGVMLTMLIALGVVGGIGYVIADQFSELSEQATRYTASMRKKTADLRMGNDAVFRQFTRTMDKITEQLDSNSNAADLRRAQPVRVVPQRLTPVARLEQVATSMFEPLASAVIVLVLVAFMLGQREDLRDRIIRLTGSNNVTLTTRLMDDAAHRVSQYLVAQTLINIAFGALVALGLYWIGVPYAALWGGLTAVLRFVPYVGTALASLMPACLAFAIFPGWAETLQTLGMFLLLDFITAYLIEPLVFGRRTGVSSFALLISALFWIWIWGPVGLLLSTPLTVCIAVLGRHVRSLRFLAIIFADEPALTPYLRYYQRLLARDEDEANVLANRKLAELGLAGVMDQVLIPALVLATQHRAQNEITDEDFEFILEANSEVVEQMRSAQQAPQPGSARIFAVSTHAAIDRLVLDMLSVAASNTGHPIVPIEAGLTLEETIRRVTAEQVDLTCIVAISPARGAEARNYCRRIRAARPDAKLLVVRAHVSTGDVERSITRMKEAGADYVAAGIHEALEEVHRLQRFDGQSSASLGDVESTATRSGQEASIAMKTALSEA
jgi:predicted PurR-regulated permease PerM